MVNNSIYHLEDDIIQDSAVVERGGHDDGAYEVVCSLIVWSRYHSVNTLSTIEIILIKMDVEELR